MPAKALIVANENSRQKRFNKALEEKAQGPVIFEYRLLGRVALSAPESVIDGRRDFYIGEAHANFDGTHVYSWVTPFALAFYRGIGHHDWLEKVAGLRAFMHRHGQIVDVAEEAFSDDAPTPLFPTEGRSISAPAGPPRELPGRSRRGDGTAQPAAPAPGSPATSGKTGSAPKVRAEALLRAHLEAPRETSLAPALATLQPDQYELITAPARQSMIIEGHPGTGKTIVASHRAAYLINEDTPKENRLDGRVLFLGPTTQYARHVRKVVDRLTSGGTSRVVTLSLPQLMGSVIGLENAAGPATRTWMDGDSKLGMLARLAASSLASMRGQATALSLEDAYNYLRHNGIQGRQVTHDPEWIGYLARLPQYKDARGLRVHTPLLAVINWELAKPDALRSIGHIIVDEAQDVTPLEWFLLQMVNEKDAWTLLGDLNQRRSDHTPASWEAILKAIGTVPGDARMERLERSYRSTEPILKYASHLLPRKRPGILPFQAKGPEPSVAKAAANDLGGVVASEVDRLLRAYPHGTVAVITMDPASVHAILRIAGWTAARHDPLLWERHVRSVTVTSPDIARGLEFDAVVVVEPADFPENFASRHGPLYTALTRPNRELSVVHTKPLPEALEGRGVTRAPVPFIKPSAKGGAATASGTGKRPHSSAAVPRIQQSQTVQPPSPSRRPVCSVHFVELRPGGHCDFCE